MQSVTLSNISFQKSVYQKFATFQPSSVKRSRGICCAEAEKGKKTDECQKGFPHQYMMSSPQSKVMFLLRSTLPERSQ